MSIAEAIVDFRSAAEAKGDFASPASGDHALAARMARAYECVSSYGADGLSAFRSLLQDPSPHVRVWVAAQLLPTDEPLAASVLEELSSLPGIWGFTAATTLKEFRAGRLRAPFATPDA
jgi:hypothetical protein